MIHSRRHVFAFLLVPVALTAAFLAVLALGFPRGDLMDAPPAVAVEEPSPGEAFPAFAVGHSTAISPLVVKDRESGPDLAEEIRTRYRLAGVTLNGISPDRSLAIIEERETGRQRRLHPGDDLDDSCRLSVVRTNSVLLATSRGIVALFSERARRPAGGGGAFPAAAASDLDATLRKFGATRVDTNTWDFSREVVMDYYRELLARPERLVKVFDSLAPVYNDQSRIEGYKVDIQGEEDFFRAIGFRQGDIVRTVNGIDMTNRRRAENLIRRYAADDLDLIIVELERDGKRQKQYYNSK